MFSDFCAEIGVANIREYEQEHLKQQAELDKKRYSSNTVIFSVYIINVPSQICDGLSGKSVSETITNRCWFKFLFWPLF